ncbi:MAG TPA: putative selenium-dependent hydroxylase accessory protein YqeC [Candidatus Agathobaculum pullistercoris]|nr:selenium cofactor biosynthesis protein YqeC [uncultured Agathobaculum sp.]HIX11171.1 putative selenium-dependent hydroxylase accessory protein YqeC [Candidatus Agathobaculum pullistercoris]
MKQHTIISVIGAGGKTTALLTLAQALSDRRVLLTTSTHIYPVAPPDSRTLLIDPEADKLVDALASPGVVCAGTAASEGKLGALAPDLFRHAVRAADITLCEADGAHHLPLKLHRVDEPVVPLESDLCLIIAGLSAWGQLVCEAVHRYDCHPDWAHDPQRRVGADKILYCVREAAAACRLPRKKVRVWLNQADTPALYAQAAPLARILSAEGLDCRAGSLLYEPAALTDWMISEI